MMNLTLGRLLLVAALLSTGSGSLVGQTSVAGSLTGYVSDATGAAIIDAKVAATNTGTGVVNESATNNSGIYRFTGLLPGVYSVSVEKTSFAKFTRLDVEIDAGTGSRVDAVLTVGPATTAVTVTDDRPLLQTESGSVSQTIDAKQIESLPTFGRNVTRLSLLAPGASMQQSQLDNHPENAGQDFDVDVNGANPYNNSKILDGVDNNEAVQGKSLLVTSQDSVQEIKFTTNSYDAEYGKVGGGLIQITTKSGSNQLHGSAFEYYRSSGFQAADPFSQTSTGVPLNVWNQFGGSLGGRIKRDKVFFFGDYQGMRNNARTSGLGTIPIPAFQNGDFSSVAAQYPIYDPATGNSDGTGRTQFPGNIIPDDRISSASKKLLALLPTQYTFPGRVDNNYQIARPGIFNQNQFNARVDYYVTPKTLVFGKYSFFQSKFFTDTLFGAIAGGSPLGGTPNAGDSSTRTNSFIGDYQYTFSPTLLHDFRVGISRLAIRELPLDSGVNGADNVGIPNINLGTVYTSGMPEFDIAGPTSGFSMGDFGLPFFETETNFNFFDTWTKTLGRHVFKFGADIEKSYAIRSDVSGRGAFGFSNSLTSNPDVANSGIGLATFLLGLTSSYSRTITLVEPQEKQWRTAYYGQDTWQATPRLTLSIGLRLDWESPVFAQEGQHIGNLDLSTGNVLLSNLYDKYAGVETLKTEFSPRLGISYRIQKDTVLRGGYGRSYFLGAAGATFGTQACCWPLKQSQTFSQANSRAPLPFTLDEGPGMIPDPPALPSSGQIALPDGIGYTFPGVGKLSHSYMDQWNVTLEHSFPSKITASVGYVGNVGRKMWDNVDINAAPPGPGDFNPRRPYFAKYGWTQGLTQRNQVIPGYSNLTSNYNGLQAKVEKRFGTGIYILSNFAWAHCLDYGTFGSEDQAFDRDSNYGNCDYVRPWTSISAFNWELPFGRGRKFGSTSNRLVDSIFGGWAVSGLVNLEKGFYSTPYADTSFLNSSDSDLRPNVVGKWKLAHPTREKWYNPAAFSQPAAYSYGNARRRSIEKPNFYSTDVSLAKSFPIWDKSRLELRWDAFNTFNQTNLAGPDNYFPSATAGQISSIVDFKRRMQIGARLSF